MADSKSPDHPLEIISATVDSVLVQIGKFFHDSSSHDPNRLYLTKGLIKQVVTTANEKLHNALDEIEIEIIKAKSVMERDLALIRSKRAERDRAVGLLQTSSIDKAQTTKVDEEVGGLDLKASREVPEMKDMGDVVMVDEPSEPLATEIDKIKTSKTATKPYFENSDSVLQGIAQNVKASLTIDTQTTDAAKKEQEVPDHLMETPTTANLGDTAFESMFNDNENPDGDDLMDFDFSNGANISQEFLNDTAFDNIPINNGELTNLNTTSNEDINSLLPGLENHLDASNTFSTVFPAATSLPETNPKPNAMVVASSAPQGFESAPTESNFDDLFSSGEFVEGTGDFNMSADGNLDELEDLDNWWRSDAT